MFYTFWKVSWQDPSQTVPKSCSRQTLIFYSSYAKDFISELYLSTRPFPAVGQILVNLLHAISHFHSMLLHITRCYSMLFHWPTLIHTSPHLRLNCNVDLQCSFWSRSIYGGAFFSSLVDTTASTNWHVNIQCSRNSPLKYFCSNPKNGGNWDRATFPPSSLAGGRRATEPF